MGLAIDGNEVHGIARGGQAFLPIDENNADGSITYNGQKYIDLANASFKITKIDDGSHFLDSGDTFETIEDINFTFVNLKDFSQYSLYQIRVINTFDDNKPEVLIGLFSIKPNVKTSISALSDKGPLPINVLADNRGINVSFKFSNVNLELILYGINLI